MAKSAGPRVITATQTDFSDIFHFAQEHYGIDWNECNTIFFNGGPLTFKSVTDVYAGDWAGYISFDSEGVAKKENASEYTKKEVLGMSAFAQGYLILGAYAEYYKVENELTVDCRN